MATENKGHQRKVEQVKQILLDLNLPILPLTTARSAFYTPDVVTRQNQRFIPMDFINSKERVTFDIGGLVIIAGKDICDFALAIIDNKLWDEYLHDFRKMKLNLPPNLTVIPMREVREFFTMKT